MRTVVDAIAASGGPGTLTVLDAQGMASQTSWAALHGRALRMATVLAGTGVGHGSRVGLLANTSLDLVTALQAVWLSGGAITMLPLPVHRDTAYPERLNGIVADGGLGLVIVDETMLGQASAAKVITLDELGARACVAEPATPARPDPADLAVLQYTSGSTRTPRGVPVRHGNLAANLLAIREAIDHDAHHPYTSVSWLPLFHDMGLIGFCALPMSCGCSLVLQSPLGFVRRPASWLEAAARYRAAVTGAPNFAYGLATRLLSHGRQVDLSSLRLLVSGGEPVDAAMMAEFVRAARPHGLDPAAITPAYGLAESTLAVTFSRVGAGLRTDCVDRRELEVYGRAVPGDRALVRLGFPVKGTRVRITDRTSGALLGERQVGHIEVSGLSVVGHYWGEPPAGDWLRTGDLGYLADGELVVCGREKDVLFAAGRNIYPQDVEAAAAAVPAVRSGGVAAFGIPHGIGDRLVVAVESSNMDNVDVLRRNVTAAVVGEVGLTPAAVLVLSPGRLPKTSSGKLRRAETRARYLSGKLHPIREGQPQ